MLISDNYMTFLKNTVFWRSEDFFFLILWLFGERKLTAHIPYVGYRRSPGGVSKKLLQRKVTISREHNGILL